MGEGIEAGEGGLQWELTSSWATRLRPGIFCVVNIIISQVVVNKSKSEIVTQAYKISMLGYQGKLFKGGCELGNNKSFRL